MKGKGLLLEEILKRLPDFERGSVKLEQLKIKREAGLSPQFQPSRTPTKLPYGSVKTKSTSYTKPTVSLINLKGLEDL